MDEEDCKGQFITLFAVRKVKVQLLLGCAECWYLSPAYSSSEMKVIMGEKIACTTIPAGFLYSGYERAPFAKKIVITNHAGSYSSADPRSHTT